LKRVLKNIFSSPYAILLIMVIAANWQFVFLQSGLEWDMMNFWMPWRHYMSECYNNGIVPLWNPYTQSGYPMHGDLQGPAYSPEAILVSFLFGQNIYVLNYCFVFYLFVASVAMYKLTYFFTSKKEVSVLAGITYSLSGFNVAHGHYFYIIISVALIPFIFYYFFKILKEGTYTDAIKFSLIIFWHITTGNPSFLIISGYLMAFVFLFFVLWKIKNRQAAEIFSVSKKIGLVLFLSVLMALPVIYNAMHIIPLTTRKDGLDLAYAGDESFYYQNFLAFFIPLITITNVDLTGYEQELWSCYIGAFTILFFIIGLVRKKNFFEWALIFIGVTGLIIALGLQWPVYPFLHKYLPLFNVFRMPNLSLLFFLMTVIIVAAKYLSDEKSVEKLFSKKVVWIFSLAWLVILTAMLYTAMKHDKNYSFSLFDNYSNLRQWIYEASPFKITLFQGLIFLITIIVLLISNLSVKNKIKVLLIAGSFDVLVNYQLGGTARIFSPEKAKDMNDYFSRFPKNFPVPSNIAMERVSGINNAWPGYWLNTSVFLKQPDFPNSNNFELTNYLDFLLKTPKLSKNVFKNSYAFFADSLVNEENCADSTFFSTKNVISFKKENLEKLKELNFSNEKNKFTCTEFFPNQISFQVNNSSPAVFVIAQNYCPLWKFTINGKSYKPFASCKGSFPAFVLPAGNWKIEAVYSLRGFNYLLLFSLSLFALLLLVVIFSSTTDKKIKNILQVLIPLIFMYCFVKFYSTDVKEKREKISEEINTYVEKEENKKRVFVNNTSLTINRAALNTNFARNEDIMRLSSMLDTLKSNEFTLLNYDSYFSKEAEELITSAYGEKISTESFYDGAKALSFVKSAKRKLISDTAVYPENILNAKNAYSSEIRIDSIAVLKYQPGDFIILSSEIGASCFDFPGITLEIHFKDKSKLPIYSYANISTIKGQRRATAGLFYRLPATAIKEIICYVWNPSVYNATIHNLKLRVYRP
jgi:hypothetical protein